MKKLLALIPAAALAFTWVSCNKDEVGTDEVISVSSKYKAVVFEYTATWCGPCGTYGYPVMHDIMHSYGDSAHQAVAIVMHRPDDLVDNEPAGQDDIATFFGFSGTPDGAVNMFSAYPNENTYTTKINQAVAANATAKAGVGMAYSFVGNVMTLNTKTVFFSDLTGTYNLGVYVVENDLQNTQNGQTGVVDHDYVLRACADGKAFGATIASNPAKGTKVDGTYSITLPTETQNKNNVKVVCVIYKVDPSTGDPTEVINSNIY